MDDGSITSPRIAVLIPCRNEAPTIANVVREFSAALPRAEVHVFDNASEDGSAALARAAGAHVRRVPLPGKGHVVRRLFADIEADVYVLVDGDSTYDAASSPAMVELLQANGFDMVVGVRDAADAAAFRPGHATGNRMLSRFLGWLFGQSCEDALSGYRVLSRRFVRSFPALGSGWEIEPEIVVHALELKMPIGTFRTAYRARPAGSVSKLHTWSDGARILGTMLRLFQAERPLAFYGTVAAALTLSALGLAAPLLQTYLETGLVPRLPTALLATGLMLLSAFALGVGLVLDIVTRGRREAKLLAYLGQAGPTRADAGS